MKKLLFSALIAAMVLGLGGTVLGAAGDIAPAAFTDIAGHEAEGELTLMGALGIFTGDAGLGGAVKPDDPITRAQFCKVVVTAMGRATTAAGLAGLQPTFTDGATIPTWAWGYVNVAVYMGIINGYADGSFGPNNPVTYAEAVTMLIRSVSGHAAQVGAGIWPYNMLFYGVDNGFVGGVDCGFANLPCTRGDMATMLFATMEINKLNAKGEEQADTSALAGRVFEGTFTGTAVGAHTLALGDPVYIVGAKDYSGLLGLNVTAVTKGGKDVFLWQTEGTAVSGVFDKPLDKDGVHYLWLKDGTKVPIAAYGGARLVLNGTDIQTPGDPPHLYTDADLQANDEVTITVGDDGDAVSVVAVRWDFITFSVVTNPGWGEVTDVTKSTSTDPTHVTFAVYGTWHVDKDVAVTINGAAAKPDDLLKFDVVKAATFGAYHVNDFYALAVTRKALEGTVTGMRTVYPGGYVWLTIKTGETSKDYQVSPWALAPFSTADGKHTYCLDEDGQLFVDKAYESGYPFVIVTGASTETGTTTKYFITVDNKGESQTYECDGDLGADHIIGEIVFLEVNGATGKVEVIHYAVAEEGWWSEETVAAIGDGTVTIDLGGGDYMFFKTELVYSDKDGDGTGPFDDITFIGLAGLKVGEEVSIFCHDADPADPGTPWVSDEFVWMLVRDDSPDLP